MEVNDKIHLIINDAFQAFFNFFVFLYKRYFLFDFVNIVADVNDFV